MVVDAFVYMYVVGAGLAFGVGTVAWIGWKMIQRSNRKTKRKAVV